MKKLGLFLSLAILLASVPASAETIVVKVHGMVCGFCAQGIKKNFSKLPSVDAVEVSLEAKTVTLKTKEKATVKDDEIKKMLLDAGYNTDDIQRKP